MATPVYLGRNRAFTRALASIRPTTGQYGIAGVSLYLDAGLTTIRRRQERFHVGE